MQRRPPLLVLGEGALLYLTRGGAVSSASRSAPCRWWHPSTIP
nr:MAG TPA: hypothetical protein [Caudoviricetes sp.]DAP92656.1 MAG TPA: hypothetical protein [Caudoviricetes sp.]DAX42273.1 MAG TPA: hypothetical protein [Caudoviricetes sp.]